MIDIIGTLPSKYMLCSLGNHFGITHIINHFGNFIGIDQFRISQNGRFLTEQHLYSLSMMFYLIAKLFRIIKRSKRMGICFGNKLHIPAFSQFAKSIYHLRSIYLQLFQCHPRDGKCHFEFSFILIYQIQ